MNCGKELRADLKFCPACGTPAPQGAPFAAPQGQVRTSRGVGPEAALPRRKSRAGKILLIILGVFLVLAAGAGVSVYFGVRYFANTIKSSEPYQVAEKELRGSAVANGVLGGIKSTGFPLGAYDTKADGSGHAAFTMSVEGSSASGQYVVMLQREGGTWRVVKGDLRMPDGVVHNILNVEEGVEVHVEGAPPAPPLPPGVGVGTVRVPGALEAGALDDKAQSKPAPTYPAAARAVRATGTVVVRVTVDESGRVILAAASSGHPLLRAASEAAARQARFAPTLKDGRPVKVIGTLTYEFE
jgi:TonB family protein